MCTHTHTHTIFTNKKVSTNQVPSILVSEVGLCKGSCSGVNEVSFLPGCGAVSLGIWYLTFQDNNGLKFKGHKATSMKNKHFIFTTCDMTLHLQGKRKYDGSKKKNIYTEI
jgi:hypothetical protein